MSDEPVPDLFGHCAPVKPVRRRRAVVSVVQVARPVAVGEEAGQAPVAAPTTAMVMPPPPPPPPVVIIERIPAPPFGLDDARTFMDEAEDEGLADLAREAVRLLRRRLDRALDDGGAFLLAHDHPGADFLPAAAAAEADRARDIEGANIHAWAGDLFHVACLMRQAAGENCKKEDFRNLL